MSTFIEFTLEERSTELYMVRVPDDDVAKVKAMTYTELTEYAAEADDPEHVKHIETTMVGGPADCAIV